MKVESESKRIGEDDGQRGRHVREVERAEQVGPAHERGIRRAHPRCRRVHLAEEGTEQRRGDDPAEQRETARAEEQRDGHDEAEAEEERGPSQVPRGDQRGGARDHDPGGFEPQEREEQPDPAGRAATDRRRDGARDCVTHPRRAHDDERDARPRDEPERRAPRHALGEQDMKGEEGVEPHPGRHGEGEARVDAHQDRHRGGEDHGRRHHPREGKARPLGREDRGVDHDDVAHREERRQAGEELAADGRRIHRGPAPRRHARSASPYSRASAA